MIVIFIDKIDDFVQFIGNRIMNEIFYEFKEISTETDLTSNSTIKIVLHYLAKIEEYIILYETNLSLDKSINSNVDEEVINTLQRIFSEVDPNLSLVKGKIREIFLSYSS